MDKKERKKIIARVHLEKIIENTKTLEDIKESKKYMTYYKKKGYDVKKFEERQKYRESLLLSRKYS